MKKVLAAFGKFTHYAFASQITIGIFGVVEYFSGHKLWAVVIIAWGLLLTISKLADVNEKRTV